LPNINISFSKGGTNKWGNEEKGENIKRNGNNPSQHQKQNQTQQPIIWNSNGHGDANVYKSWPHAASYPASSSQQQQQQHQHQQQHPFFLFHHNGEGKSNVSGVTSSHNESIRGHTQTTTQPQQSHVINRYEMLNNHPPHYYSQQHNTNSNPAWMSYQTHAGVAQNINPHSMAMPPGFNTQTSNHYANNHKITGFLSFFFFPPPFLRIHL